ncbi:MAG: serine hydrolase domain-containing protein [Bacteroidia bacterium]
MKFPLPLSSFFKSSLFVCSFLLIATIAQAQSESEKTQRLDQTIEQLRENLSIPGMAIAVSQNGKMLYSQAFGYADLKEKIPATDSTLFRLASVSKLLTNMAIVKLHQEGKLNIEEAVETYLPDYPHAGKGVTIQRLCRHLGGIRHYQGGDFTNGFKHYENTEESLALFIDDPLSNEPGSEYQYSTFAYTLLQAVIEAASGKDFLSYLEEDIFTPLGMKHSVPDQVGSFYANRSQLYRVNKKGKAKSTSHDDPSYKWGGGGMLSSVCDMIAFGEAHLQGDFLSAESRKLMFTPAVVMPSFDDKTSIGLTWRIGTDARGQSIYHHAGSMNGARSFLLLCPEEGLVISILSNANVLDWIPHLAFSVKDILLQPLPSASKELATIWRVVESDTKTEFGNIQLSGDYPIYQCQVDLPELIGNPLILNLCATNEGESIQLKNVKVNSSVLYFEASWNAAEKSNQLELVYRDDDEVMKKSFLLMAK